uniref:Putative serpin n=1 Tax=Ixodes scapularis TaxID=6945 RepID=A0A4D5RN74_IXOSC
MKTLIVLMCSLVVVWARYENEMRLANNRFAVDLLRGLPSSPEKNIFFSPYSISTAMGMVFAGAEGETRKDLYDGFGYLRSGLKEDWVLQAYADHAKQLQVGQSQSTFDVANAAAIHEHLALLSTYENTLDSTFHAQLLKVDFVNGGPAAVDEINRWVKQKTHGKIDKLFDGALDPLTRLVLLNAIFFKGAWSTKFDESATTKKQFLNGGTTPTQVDTMTNRIRIGYKPFPQCRLEVVELPYAGGNYSMVILLPRGSEGIEGFKHNLTEHLLQDFIGHVEPREVTVSLPKFKLETEYSLKDNLKNLGITEMFSAQADLSGITSDADLTVSDVVHKAVVEVNEEGTEAAAASGVVAVNRLIGVPSLEFNVNQPFLFFIRNTQTQDFLFAGQVNHL